MNKIYLKILTVILILGLAACGPKPKIFTEPVTRTDMQEEEIKPFAFYHYVNGVIAELEENYELAMSYYTSALSHAPGNYDISVALANIYMGMRQFEKAWEILEPLKNNYSEGVLMKADCQRALGKWKEAVKYYELAIHLNPRDVAPYWYLGNYYRQIGEYDKAVAYYEKMTHLNDSEQIFTELAQLYIRAGNNQKAIETFERAIEINSGADNSESYLSLAELLNQAGQNDSAQVVMKNLLRVAGGTVEARMKLIEIYIDADKKDQALAEIHKLAEENPNQSYLLGQLGTYSLELNDIDLAREYFQKQVDLDDTNFLPQYYLGRIALFSNEFEKAKGYFWKVIDLVDSVPDGWINLAEVYRVEDSLDMAVDVLREGMERVTFAREEIQIYLSRYYAQMEMYQGVVNILDGLVDTTTTDIGLLFTMASALERTDNFARSERLFKRILELEPDFHPALNYLGYMYADSGIHLTEARDMIAKAVEMDSTNAAYLDSYGWVLFKIGKISEAQKYIERAIDLMDEMDAVVYDHLAEIYYAQGRVEDARRIWEKALVLDPDNIAIKEKLDR